MRTRAGWMRGGESVTAVYRRAVVIGGSIGGMMAARVLADHSTGLLVERDHFTPGAKIAPEFRMPATSTSS